ncbi:MAG: hypothetical protein R3B13_08170 [Polyangiaceae bacterium]
MRRFLASLCLSLLPVALGPACGSSDPPEVTSGPRTDAGGDAKDADVVLPDGASLDTGTGDASSDADPDAPLAPVRVGIWATPASGEAGPAPGDALTADLAVLSAGARVGMLRSRWSDLFDGATPSIATWNDVDVRASAYRSAGAEVIACLAVIDRTEAVRPTGINGAWDSPALTKAGEALVDRAFDTFGDELTVLSLGLEVDRYLAVAPPAQRSAFVAFVRHVFDYAHQHPKAPNKLRLGIGFNRRALINPASPEVRDLAAAGDVVVLHYVPLDDEFALDPQSNPLADLDALYTALSAEAAAVPAIVLQEVALPSSAAAGGSDAKQEAFFEAFFKALSVRRERFPMVIAGQLNDGPQADCELAAGAAQNPPSPAAIGAYCSRGVKSSSGNAKPAQNRVFEALAAFSSP